MTDFPPLLELHDIRKNYGAIEALKGISFTIGKGEVVALLGDNGAGKSTLVKIISGGLEPTSGRLVFEGQDFLARSPAAAKAAGIETVYQDLALADNLDVAANIFLGRELTYSGILRPFLDIRRMEGEARRLLGRLKINIPSIRQKVRQMSGGQRQSVAIARAMHFDSDLIILDEPTNDLDVNTLRALEEGLEGFAGCAVISSHDRWFLDRIATHILAFEGDSAVTFFDGNYTEYEEDRKKRLGKEADQPHRVKFRKLTR